MTSSPKTPEASTATFALLGLLAVQSWTGYELTRQAHRSLRNIWPTSEANLYREQKRLVALGWARSVAETVGRRPRQRYTITAAGRRALAAWMATDPAEPAFEVEGIVRTFFGDMGTVEALESSMRTTARLAGAHIDEMLAYVDEYLDNGGPFPERLHVVAMAVEVITDVLAALERFYEQAADEVSGWDTVVGRGLDPVTRARLERIRERHGTRSAPEH